MAALPHGTPGRAGASGATDESGILTLGNLSINLNTFEATVDGELIDLSYREFELLWVLAVERNRILLYDEVLSRVWKDSSHGNLGHLHVVLHRLRAKLTNIRPFEIRTVRGRGYGLVQPIHPDKRP